MGKGKINVSVENIFPLIKKFLYSDQEIFLRELVSNATDALTMLNHISSTGEIKGDTGDLGLEIKVNKKEKTKTSTASLVHQLRVASVVNRNRLRSKCVGAEQLRQRVEI